MTKARNSSGKFKAAVALEVLRDDVHCFLVTSEQHRCDGIWQNLHQVVWLGGVREINPVSARTLKQSPMAHRDGPSISTSLRPC